MTVQELITKLSQYPLDSKVSLVGDWEGEGAIVIYASDDVNHTKVLDEIEDRSEPEPWPENKPIPDWVVTLLATRSTTRGSYAEAIHKFVQGTAPNHKNKI